MSLFDPNTFNISEGKIAFTIRVGQVNWTDNQTRTLVKLTREANFISLLKNESNKLIFSHFSVDSGLSILEVDTSGFSREGEYSFILSWSIPENKLDVFVNGELKASGHINGN